MMTPWKKRAKAKRYAREAEQAIDAAKQRAKAERAVHVHIMNPSSNPITIKQNRAVEDPTLRQYRLRYDIPATPEPRPIATDVEGARLLIERLQWAIDEIESAKDYPL